MKTVKRLLMLSLIVGILFVPAFTAWADTGPKPTLEIHVKDIDTTNYYLDLLGKEGEFRYFEATEGNKKYDYLHDQPIYSYNENGWKAIMLRTWLLNGKLTGEPVVDAAGKITEMIHSFGYVVPKSIKIIIQKADGSLQVSDTIESKYFNTVVDYDFKENRVLSVSGSMGSVPQSNFTNDYFWRLVVTLLIEITIALPFFYKKLNWLAVVAVVNIVTQTLLTAGMVVIYALAKADFVTNLIGGEVLVFIAEYLFYVKKFKEADSRVIALYTFLANLASFLAGIFIFP